jgi:hypothetical protein
VETHVTLLAEDAYENIFLSFIFSECEFIIQGGRSVKRRSS